MLTFGDDVAYAYALENGYMRRSLGGTWFVATAIIGLPSLLNAHEVSRGATW